MQYTTCSENYSSSVRGDSPSKWGNKEDKGYVYKKSSYQYSNSGNNNIASMNKSLDTNIDQLDALLEDLRHERQITKDKDILSTSSNYRTIEREREREHIEPSGTVTKSVRVMKTSQRSVPRPLQDEIDGFSTSEYSTLKSNGYPSIQRDYQSNELYGSSNIYESKNKLYESNRIIDSTDLMPSATTKTTTTTSQLEKDLQNLPLTEDILPLPGTKVTTTVRTYTYEVPATGTLSRNTPLTSSTRYNTIQRNEVNNSTLQSSPMPSHVAPVVPQTVVYNTESYSTTNRTNDRPITTNHLYEVREHRETNTLQKNLPLQQPRSPQPTGSSKTIIYKMNTTENVHTGPEFKNYPQRSPEYPIHQEPPQTGPYGQPNDAYTPGPTTTKYIYKESSNVVNTTHGSPVGPSDPQPRYLPPAHPQRKSPPAGYAPNGNGYPPHGPPNTSHVTYKYSSSSTTNTRQGPDSPYGKPSPTTQPAPFPVDGVEYPANSSPPQKVDELMQTFGQVDSVDRADLSTPRKREIETAVATPSQHVPTINKAGKEVYYPPGHEMMLTKREEMAAGSAAGGRWAKGSGMYEYESGYKSKTKTKQGGAVVPICLPLCCAMPCSIM